MKKYIVLLIIISKIFAQTDTTDYSEYFPLAIGNTWQYFESNWVTEVDRNIMFTIIDDTLMPNGNQYYTVKWEPSSSIISFKYLRYDTSQKAICTYIESVQRDTILFDLDLEISDTVFYGDYYLGSLCVMDTGFTNIGYITNQSTPYIEYSFFYCATWLRNYYLAKGFGLFLMDSGFRWLEVYDKLIAVKIDGVTYGNFVSLDDSKNIIYPYKLSQNYPNPFNSETKISFILPEKSRVYISIYDIRGQFIENLVEGTYEKGKYNFTWDAKELKSGIYLIRMRANNYYSVKKCLLLK